MPTKHTVRIGDTVQWTCKPFGEKPFTAQGIVLKVKQSTFGSSMKGIGASIEVSTKKYHKLFNKKNTFVGVHNLTVLD